MNRGGRGERGGRGGYRGGHHHQGPRDQPIAGDQPQKECTHGLKCLFLYKRDGCRSIHTDEHKSFASQKFIIQKHYNGQAVAYMNSNGRITLYRFEQFPVELEHVTDVFEPNQFYLVNVGNVNIQGDHFNIRIERAIGNVGDYAVEENLVTSFGRKYNYSSQNQTHLLIFQFDDIITLQTDEEGKILELPDGLLKGKFKVKFGGQECVSAGGNQYFFEFKTNDSNRAIHGSEVIFKVKPPKQEEQKGNNGRAPKTLIQVVHVKYPKNNTRVGVLRKNRGQIYFVSLDNKFQDMLVRDIEPTLFDSIKDDSEIFGFSYIKRSQFSSLFVDKHFVKGEFLGWSAFEKDPYIKLTEDLGSIYDLDIYKVVIMLNQGITPDMYPFKAQEQAKEILEQFDEKLPERVAQRVDLQSELVFTIDSPGAQALDDAISVKQVAPDCYRVSIHIADVASLIPKGSPLDQEALKRAATTYVLKTFYMPMLPKELNSSKCSLLQDQPRLAATLSVDINNNGLVDFDTAKYELTVIRNTVRLSYTGADELIRNQDKEKFLLPETPNIVETELRETLQALYSILQKRKEFRTQFEGFAVNNEQDDGTKHGVESQVVIEELMLITSSILPKYKDNIIASTESLIHGLGVKLEALVAKEVKANIVEDEQLEDLENQALELSKKKSSVQEVEEVVKQPAFFNIDAVTEEAAAQFEASKRAKNYLERFFSEINVEFKCGSRAEIENSFKTGKLFKEGSDLFSQYMDSQYAKSYQHYANIVSQQVEANKSLAPIIPSDQPIVDISLGPQGEEHKEAPLVKEAVTEEKPLDAVKELAVKMESLALIEEPEETSRFSKKVNKELLTSIHATSKELQLKFSNPIRDYCHLLSNRLVILLVDLEAHLKEATLALQTENYNSEQIAQLVLKLRKSLDSIVKHLKEQITYQQELTFIKQSNQKMKTAEREINRVKYAFSIVKVYQLSMYVRLFNNINHIIVCNICSKRRGQYVFAVLKFLIGQKRRRGFLYQIYSVKSLKVGTQLWENSTQRTHQHNNKEGQDQEAMETKLKVLQKKLGLSFRSIKKLMSKSRLRHLHRQNSSQKGLLHTRLKSKSNSDLLLTNQFSKIE